MMEQMDPDETYRFSLNGIVGEDITLTGVRDHLLEAGRQQKDAHFVLDSPGGDSGTAVAIFYALREFRFGVFCTIHRAASAGALIAMACTDRAIARNGHIMIHEAGRIAVGNASELRDVADSMEELDDSLAELLAERSGIAIERIRDMMAQESWVDADAALEMRLVSEIAPPADPPPEGPSQSSSRVHFARWAIEAQLRDQDDPSAAAEFRSANLAAAAQMPVLQRAPSTKIALPATLTDRHIDLALEVRRRRREILEHEAQRLSAIQRRSSMAYRPGLPTWTCQDCGAPNTHSPGEGINPSPCFTCLEN